MAGLPDLSLATDAAQLGDDAAAWGEEKQPGWALEPADLETILIEMFARMASILAILAQTHDREIFRDFVATVFRIPALSPTSASGTVTFTFGDTLGHTVPAGTQVSVADVAFETAADLTAAPGASTVTGTVVAVIPGAAGSGLSGAVTVEDLLDYVAGAALVGITTGGTDGETVDEYVDRVHDELPTLSFAVVTPRDAELIAMSVPGVDLAMSIDRYVPAGPGGTPAAQTDVDGAITVAVRDAAGQPVGGLKTTVAAAIDVRRVSGLLVSVIDPTITPVDVTFTAHSYPGWDQSVVQADADAAVQGFLSAGNYGRPRGTSPATRQDRLWIDEPIIRRNDLFGVLYDVPGLRHVDTLTLALNGGTLGTADLTLPGPAPLPTPGAVNGTVIPST
jgi:uncharacterized phage protein gp47/JayE